MIKRPDLLSSYVSRSIAGSYYQANRTYPDPRARIGKSIRSTRESGIAYLITDESIDDECDEYYDD